MKWGNNMSRRNNLGLAEVVAEKMEDLNLLGEYSMYEFLGRTLIAFEQGDTNFINNEILEPLYNIDDKTDFEKEIIYDVEDRLPMNDEQQAVWEVVQEIALGGNPLIYLKDKLGNLETMIKDYELNTPNWHCITPYIDNIKATKNSFFILNFKFFNKKAQFKNELCFLFTPPNRVPRNIEPCSSGRCPIVTFTAPSVHYTSEDKSTRKKMGGLQTSTEFISDSFNQL